MDQEQRKFQNVDNTLPKSAISSYAFSRKQPTHEVHSNKNGGLSIASLRVLFQEALSQSTKDFENNKIFDYREKIL